MTVVAAMMTAAIAYTPRQPASWATIPANVRDSKMPVSSPDSTVPIARARSVSAARVAAYGISIWMTTDVSPMTMASAPSTRRLGAAALAAMATVSMLSRMVNRRRRRVMSAAGTISSSPTP